MVKVELYSSLSWTLRNYIISYYITRSTNHGGTKVLRKGDDSRTLQNLSVFIISHCVIISNSTDSNNIGRFAPPVPPGGTLIVAAKVSHDT